MRRAKKIAYVDTASMYSEFISNFSLCYSIRDFYEHAHFDYKTIELRVPSSKIAENKTPVDYFELYANQLYSVDTKYISKFPEVTNFIKKFSKDTNSDIGRISITKLSNETKYYPHVDVGFYFIFHTRYHLVLESVSTSVLDNGKVLEFKTGDLYTINNLVPHSGKTTHSNSERTHLIFDTFPRSIISVIYMYLKWLFFYIFFIKDYRKSAVMLIASPFYLLEAIKVTLTNNHP